MSDVLPRPADLHADASPKRRQALEAATALFLAQGYGAVSMDAVAKAANISKATLYAHFASKDVLFASMINDCGLATHIDDALFPEHVTDLRAALEALGRRVTHFMLQERTLAIYRIAMAESARFPELGRAFFDNGPAKFCSHAEAWLRTQQDAGLVRQADPGIAAQQLMALLRSGVFLRASLALPPAPAAAEIEATVRAAADTWLRAYATAPDGEAGSSPPHGCA
jgi:TetR/AcrR family transcriptional repressor of mexJK operon